MKTIKKLEHYKPFGYFSSYNDVLKVLIPVASEDFELVQDEDISSDDINALILRITDDTYDRRNDEPITHIIQKDFKLSETELSSPNLNRDQKLFIMVYNSTEEFDKREINDFKMCVKDHQSYDEIDCYIRYKDIDLVRPNEHNGDILIGF
jgi:hypothetical protein